jgi:nucleoid DNA-binding protein
MALHANEDVTFSTFMAHIAQVAKQRYMIRPRDTEFVMRTVLEQVRLAMATGYTINWPNFGTFRVIQTRPTVRRNPKKPGSDRVIPSYAKPVFIPAKLLKRQVRRTLPAELFPMARRKGVSKARKTGTT